MPGNSVLNSKWGSRANKIQKILQVWKHLGYLAIQPRYGMENGPQFRTPPFFSSEVIPDFPPGSSCPPQPIFTSSAEKALWMQVIDKRHNSFLRGARDLRISRLHNVLPSPDGPLSMLAFMHTTDIVFP